MAWYLYCALIAGGIIAGYINSIAGSGSLLTLPLLLYLGLPPGVANGTNRVGILMQCVAGTAAFHRGGELHVRGALLRAVPAIMGAVIGAAIAVSLDELVIRRAIGVVMLVMVMVVMVRPRRIMKEFIGSTFPLWLQALIFFLIGLYGGFLQAGVGIFLIAALVMGSGYDLVRANAVKLLIILCYTVTAIPFFAGGGQIDWGVGVVLGTGFVIGGWSGARSSMKWGESFVWWVLIGVIAISGIVFVL